MRASPRREQAEPEVRARIFDARREALARPPASDSPAASTHLLVLAVGDHRVGLPVEHAREVLRPGPIARIPLGGPLVGVRSVRGEILALADIAQLLQLTGAAPLSQRWVAVVHDSEAPLGLLVDAAVDLVDMPARAPDRETHGMHGAHGMHGLVSRITTDGLLVIDVGGLLTDPRLFIDGRPVSSSTHPTSPDDPATEEST